MKTTYRTLALLGLLIPGAATAQDPRFPLPPTGDDCPAERRVDVDPGNAVA